MLTLSVGNRTRANGAPTDNKRGEQQGDVVASARGRRGVE